MSLSGRYKIHSPLGSFLSLLVCVTGVWLFIYLGRDMFNKTNPRLSQISSVSHTSVALDAERNLLRFGFLNGYGNWGYLFDDHYFRIEAYTYKGGADNYEAPKWTPISYDKCESVLYPGTELICLKGGTAEGEPIVFGENVDSVVFYFRKCLSYQTWFYCGDPSWSNMVISLSRLQWENYEYIVDLENYKEPFGQAFAARDDPLDANSMTIVTYQNRYTTINSYDGWILTSPSIEQRTTMWSKTTTRTPIQNDGIFLKIEITKGGEHMQYYRQYPQIQTILASVGGILSILMIVFRVSLLPYLKFIKDSLIVKSIYNVKYLKAGGAGSEKLYMYSDDENENKNENEDGEMQKQSAARLKLRNQLKNKKKFETLGEIQMTTGRMTSENPMIQTETRREANFVLSENEDGNLEIQSFPELPPPMSSGQSVSKRKVYPFFERDEPFPEDDHQFVSLSISPSTSSPSYWSPTGHNQNSFGLSYKGGVEGVGAPETKNEKKKKKKPQKPQKPPKPQKPKNEPFDVGFLKWLGSLFKPQVEVEVTKKALEEVEGNIDILSIVKMKREINLLKQVLLSDSQRALFENIQPPQISVNTDNKIEVESLRNHFEGDQLNAEEIYSRLSKEETKTHLDERILTFYKKQK